MSKEEIKIGDEVLHNTERYIVVAISNGSYYCLRADGKFLGEYFENVLEKTGKHFDQIDKVLDKIRAEIQRLRGCSCSCSDGIIDDVEDILDKYKADPEIKEGRDKE